MSRKRVVRCSEEGHGEYGKTCFHAAAKPDSPPAATVPLRVEVREIPFCADCGCSTIVHAGARSRGPCLVHPDCGGFVDADAA